MNDDKKAALLRLFQEATRPASDDGRPGNGISINIHTGDGDGNGIGNTIINADIADLEGLAALSTRAAGHLARLEALAAQAASDLEQIRAILALGCPRSFDCATRAPHVKTRANSPTWRAVCPQTPCRPPQPPTPYAMRHRGPSPTPWPCVKTSTPPH